MRILTGGIRIGIVIALASFLAAAGSADAGNAPGDVCATLATTSPRIAGARLTTFAEPVLGKSPEFWSPSDFAAVEYAASACDGYVGLTGSRISASAWRSTLRRARAVVLPVSDASRHAEATLAAVRRENSWLPRCQDLLRWRRDRDAWSDNSQAIFGTDLSAMAPEGFDAVRVFLDRCAAVASMIADARTSIRDRVPETGRHVAEDISYVIERIETSRLLETEMQGAFVVSDGDRVLPPGFLNAEGRSVVSMIAKRIRERRTLTEDEIVAASTWSSKVLAADPYSLEAHFARAVRNRVARQIFKE